MNQSNDDVPVAPLEWAYAYRRIENRPFTLERHKPLEAIYNDNHKHIVVMKPAQVGVSELAITRVLHALDVGAKFWNTHKNGLNIGYLFPTLTALSSFSKERVSGVLAEHEHLASLFEAGFDEGGRIGIATTRWPERAAPHRARRRNHMDLLPVQPRESRADHRFGRTESDMAPV